MELECANIIGISSSLEERCIRVSLANKHGQGVNLKLPHAIASLLTTYIIAELGELEKALPADLQTLKAVTPIVAVKTAVSGGEVVLMLELVSGANLALGLPPEIVETLVTEISLQGATATQRAN